MNKLFLTILLSITVCVNAQTPIRTWGDYPSENYTCRRWENDPLNTRVYTFKNGLTLIASVNKNAPRVSTAIAVKAGSKNDPSDHTGLAHYLEHMLFKGTDKYGSLDWETEKKYLAMIDSLYNQYNKTKDENMRTLIYAKIDSVSKIAAKYAIANEYDKMCQAIGASGTNAFTSVEQTVYVNEIPSNKIVQWLDLEAERYRNPILRLFHTELEAVYEEKNISLDRDGSKVEERMNAELFKNHNYGLQTTIGTIEHLKNPSLQAIRDYYKKYYVPNNMAIIMSGDFEPDSVANLIAQKFSYMVSKPVEKYTYKEEMLKIWPNKIAIVGPDAEYITLGFRLPGAHTAENKKAQIVDYLLNNASAGLMDLNLVKKQKVQSASSFVNTMNDYSVFRLTGRPKLGQNLDEVKELMLAQLKLIAEGDFDEKLLQSIILNIEIDRIKGFKENGARINFLMDVFTSNCEYQKAYNELYDMSLLKKEEISEFVKEYLTNGRVEIYKKTGTDSNVVKIKKPSISSVELNRDKQSEFLKEWLAQKSDVVKPEFYDLNKMKKSSIRNIPFTYTLNKNNRIFTLTYVYNYGKLQNKLLPFAMKYLQLASTSEMSNEEMSKTLYSLACSYNASSTDKRSTISITGPRENLEKAVQLVENLLQNCMANNEVFSGIIASEKKRRADIKLNNRAISSALLNYTMYGEKNPYNDVLSNEELDKLDVTKLLDILHTLNNVKHQIVYYGNDDEQVIKDKINMLHKGLSSTEFGMPKVFMPKVYDKKMVYFTPYKQNQASIYWYNAAEMYDSRTAMLATFFNQYFGGDMSSVVFQNIREAKALAYSTYASFSVSTDAAKSNYVVGFIGTQADKFHDAIAAMNELFVQLPHNEEVYQLAKESIKNRIESDRTDDENLFWIELALQELNQNENLDKMIYEQIPNVQFSEINEFHKQNFAKKIFAMCVVADSTKITKNDLSKHGEVKEIGLLELFGF